MSKVKLNPVLEQIRGQIGDLVFKRYGDRVIISRKPDLEGVEPTAAQLAVRERFRQAALFGKMMMAEIEALDLLVTLGGDGIVVQASDDFDVASVSLSLTDEGGNPIESGQAVETPPESGRWVYTATAAVPTGTTVRIAVTVADRPGGQAQAEEEKVV